MSFVSCKCAFSTVLAIVLGGLGRADDTITNIRRTTRAYIGVRHLHGIGRLVPECEIPRMPILRQRPRR
jgi:hypothetical protein